jgi:hypothetical protein
MVFFPKAVELGVMESYPWLLMFPVRSREAACRRKKSPLRDSSKETHQAAAQWLDECLWTELSQSSPFPLRDEM